MIGAVMAEPSHRCPASAQFHSELLDSEIQRTCGFDHGNRVCDTLFAMHFLCSHHTVLAREASFVVALHVSPLCFDASRMWCRSMQQ